MCPNLLPNSEVNAFPGGEYTMPTTPSRKEEEEKENGKPGPSKSPDFLRTDEEEVKKRPTVVLHSEKMKQLKDLLLAEKLNTHAISLHLTAQSQASDKFETRSFSSNVARSTKSPQKFD